MATPMLRIDREHSLRLLAGQAVTVKVPANAKTVSFMLDLPKGTSSLDSFAHICDVVFNGRKA